MDLVSREALRLGVLDVRHEGLHGAEMLRAGVGPHTVAIGAEDAVHRQVHRLAENIPETVVHGGGIGKLPHRAVELGGELGHVQNMLPNERALGIGQPSKVAPVRVTIPVGEDIVALDTAIGDDGGILFAAAEVGAALPGVGFRGLEDVDLHFLDGEVGQVRGVDDDDGLSSGAARQRAGRGGAEEIASR